jgi:nitroreductase
VSDLRELRRLEPLFYRAPSAHNTQPWLLEYGPESVELRYDPERHLRAGDPTRRDLYLSLGAFVEAVVIASASEGVALRFAPRVEADRVGTFTRGDATDAAFTADDLARRRTSRLPYEPRRLEAEDVAAARAQLGSGAVLHEVSARELLGLYVRADHHLYDAPLVVSELRSWLRLSRRDPRFEQDGLSYECLALSRAAATALAVVLRPRVYGAVRAARLHRVLTAATKGVLSREGSVLVLEGRGDAPEHVLDHGRSLLRVWLALARRGLYTHPLSQILDCAETEQELSERLAVTEPSRLLSVFRAGRSATPARSHRLR